MICSKPDLKKLKKIKSLWRYMDLSKFLNLIITGELYFSNLNELKQCDPYEGDFASSSDDRLLLTELLSMSPRDGDYKLQNNKETQDFLQFMNKINNIRDRTYINCWHLNEHENHAMWKVYGKDDVSIAIVTTIDSLEESIIADKEITAHLVQYKNNLPSKLRNNNVDMSSKKLKKIIKKTALFKKVFFKQENEFRLIYQIDEDSTNDNKIKVDLNKLIQHIYISPTAKPFVKETIEDILKKYNINARVSSSRLSEDFYKLLSLLKLWPFIMKESDENQKQFLGMIVFLVLYKQNLLNHEEHKTSENVQLPK